MLSNYPACLAFTLSQEGGWSDNNNDPGGCTMQGITLSVFRDWKGDNSITCAQLHKISSADVAALYHQKYWAPVHGDALPIGVDLAVWDMAVNAGVGGSSKILQSVVGVTVDGSIGPATLQAISGFDPTTLVNNICDRQAAYYRSLSGFIYFGKGWLSRVETRRHAALAMTSAPASMVISAPPVHPSDNPPEDFFSRLSNI